MNFFIAMNPPTATAQMKQVRIVNGKPLFYDPASVKAARKLLTGHLILNRPEAPMEGAVALSALWLFPKGGRHLRLGTTPAGDCLLLGPNGCRLPRASRPWYCRIFPFWVRWGEVVVIPSPTCLGVRKASNKAATLELYSLTDAEVLEIFASLRRAWELADQPWFIRANPL